MEKHQRDAAFLFVYVREAHPSDEWQMDVNVQDEVVLAQPTSLPERAQVAVKCCQAMKLNMPCVVDTLDDAADTMYAAWPERMYVIAADGRIVYAGRQGPWGFKPEEVEAVLKDLADHDSR